MGRDQELRDVVPEMSDGERIQRVTDQGSAAKQYYLEILKEAEHVMAISRQQRKATLQHSRTVSSRGRVAH